jgi:hypothetical protein
MTSVFNLVFYMCNTGQFKKKVTLSHVYNEVTSEPTVTRYTVVGDSKRRAFCCGVAILQHGLPGGGGPKQVPASITNKL